MADAALAMSCSGARLARTARFPVGRGSI